METKTQTLGWFLLARYQEIEDDLDPNDDTWQPLGWWDADLAAKRQIVALCQTAVDEPPRVPGEFRAMFEMRASFAEAMLRALAQPYADHPDFRQEWRA